MGIEANAFCAESALLSTIEHRRAFHYAQRNDSDTVQMWYSRLEQLAKACLFGGTIKAFLLNKFVIGLCGGGGTRYMINHRRNFHYARRDVNESIQQWIIRLKCLAEPCHFQEHLEAFLFNKLVVSLGSAVLTTTSGLKLNSLLKKMYKLDTIEMDVDQHEQSTLVECAKDTGVMRNCSSSIAVQKIAEAAVAVEFGADEQMQYDNGDMQANIYRCKSCPQQNSKYKSKYNT